ncbi:MAG TPA: exodeoxyribonuclease VII small subunit [Firmicutes bacterium]|jgi:exodeoxyribonuclease VII small subunit|nr:exodeoxyribonuclease VII small subunit [Bacillota bacterium]
MNKAEMREKSFEEAIARLEQIIEFLEKGELSLEENLNLFEEGIALARHCRGRLDEAQGKVEILLGVEEGKAQTEPFQPEEEENTGE